MSLIIDNIESEGYITGNTISAITANITNLIVTNSISGNTNISSSSISAICCAASWGSASIPTAPSSNC